MLKTSSGQPSLAGLEKTFTGRDPDDSAVPVPVRKSVRFMLAGGAVTTVLGLFWLIMAFADRNAIIGANGQKVNNGQFAGGLVEVFLIQYLIPVAIWVLMARFNRSGQNWARIVASVLCAIDTYLTFGIINSLRAGQTFTVANIVVLVLWLASWIAGVIAIALLWRGESSVYFKERAAARR
ncbi:MAG TPA: hypothetical protein VFO01_01190 [Trebonia sp.]|nr:hypothetical protein [Trebonia sp.]